MYVFSGGAGAVEVRGVCRVCGIRAGYGGTGSVQVFGADFYMVINYGIQGSDPGQSSYWKKKHVLNTSFWTKR